MFSDILPSQSIKINFINSMNIYNFKTNTCCELDGKYKINLKKEKKFKFSKCLDFVSKFMK